MNKIMNLTVGGDIECFTMVKDTAEIVSAEPYIQGTKHNPFNFDKASEFFATSIDNVLAEFTLPPVIDKFSWEENIQKSIDYLNSILPNHLCTTNIPAARLNPLYLQTENARLFGCDPDYNAWERRINPKPRGGDNLRTSGFHIHFGYDNPRISISEMIVKSCDLHLGVPGVLMEPDNERRSLYGKAGCFRTPPHGVEYRTLSGWFASSRELRGWVFEQAMRAVEFVNNDRLEEIEAVGPQIVEAINKSDKVLAGNLVRQFNLELI